MSINDLRCPVCYDLGIGDCGYYETDDPPPPTTEADRDRQIERARNLRSAELVAVIRAAGYEPGLGGQ